MGSTKKHNLSLVICATLIISASPIARAVAQSPGRFVSVKILLPGNWEHAEISSSVAFGNGNNGHDQWEEDVNRNRAAAAPAAAVNAIHEARWTEILFDTSRRCYYFVYQLEIDGTNSTQVAANFRYKKDRVDGVFSVSFRWPH